MGIEQIGDTISSGSNMGSAFVGKVVPVLTKIWFGVRIAIYVSLVGLVLLMLWKFWLQYNKKCIVYQLSGSKIVNVKFDRCMVQESKETGVKRIITWSKIDNVRLSLPLQAGKYKYISAKKDLYIFWLDDNMQLQPTEIERKEGLSFVGDLADKANKKILGGVMHIDTGSFSEDELASIKPRPQERDAWASIERKTQIEKLRKENPFLKYGQVLLPIVSGALAFLIFYFAFQELGVIGNSIGGGLQAIAQNCLT